MQQPTQPGRPISAESFPTDPTGLPEATRPELLELNLGDVLAGFGFRSSKAEHAVYFQCREEDIGHSARIIGYRAKIGRSQRFFPSPWLLVG